MYKYRLFSTKVFQLKAVKASRQIIRGGNNPMAINFTGISNQGNVAKNNRTPVEDSTTSKASVDANTSSSGGIMAEDTVKLSGAAQTLQNQESKINGLSDIDQQKVDQIKQAIASGNYKIDSQKLASNMASMDSLF